MIEQILQLMERQNISASKLTSECGLSSSALTEWKKGKAKPSAEALIKIANYFDVSVDYLLGNDKKGKHSSIVATGMSIARGGEIRTYKLSDERLKFLQELAEKMEQDDRRN